MKTKILYVSEAPIYGGAERYLIALAEGMDRTKFDIEMVISDQAPPQLREALDKLNVLTIPIAPIQGKTDIAGITRHHACFKARKPDIVHFNLSNPLHGQYAMLAARFASVPNRVATLHLPPRNTTPTRRGRFFERQTVCNLDTLIAVCHASQALMIQHFGIHPNRTAAVYNGIDTTDFDEQLRNLPPAILTQNSELIIGTIGRLSKQKGYDTLLDAVPQVIAKVPNVRLVIAGEGPEEDALKTQSKKNNIQDNVDFLGFRSDPPALIQAFDLFVLPSRYESFPITILEVMAASKPIVSTRVDGIPESVLHGQTGLLVEPENPVELTEAILALLEDKELRTQMSMAARQRVEGEFSLARQVEDTQAIYTQLSEKSCAS